MTNEQGQTSSSADLARLLTDIATTLLAPSTVDETLARILALAIASIEGCDEAGLCARPGLSAEVTPTSPLVAELDRAQEALEEGPCLDVLAGLSSVYVPDLTEDTTWPAFSTVAAAAGMRSALAYRLVTGAETLGALQLYARLPAAFNATDRAQGLLFAAHAGMALAVARDQAVERGRVVHLQAALVSREIIGQAQGILMERERITADQAFELLRRSSQHLNVKLREVAQALVDTGVITPAPTVDP